MTLQYLHTCINYNHIMYRLLGEVDAETNRQMYPCTIQLPVIEEESTQSDRASANNQADSTQA